MINIIMPCYNAEKYILKTISKIQAQTREDWRLFLVDDGSTDDTLFAVSSIKDDRIIIRTGPNQGVSHARNHARELILQDTVDRDNLVAYSDADDLWYPNHLERSIEAFIKKPGLDFVYSDVNCIYDNGQKAFSFGIPYHQILDIEKLKVENPIYTSTVVHRIRCFYVGDFDNSLNSIEDWDMWLRFALSGYSMFHIPEVLTDYVVKTKIVNGEIEYLGVAGERTPEKWERFKEKITEYEKQFSIV
jgi:glycosyltransferase involved in cell wall biosynthesis